MFKFFRRRYPTRNITIENTELRVRYVYVEVIPERFRLEPGKTLVISYEAGTFPIDIQLTDDGIIVFPNEFGEIRFTIDGKDVQSLSWQD